MWKRFCQLKIVRFFASLKLAVCTILALVLLMVWGTFTESYYSTEYAQRQVYLSPLFIGVEVFLFLNILFAALVRLPFKKRLTGFYIIHLGLLTILIGAAVTAVYGIDGSIRLIPNDKTSALIIKEPVFYAFYQPHGHLASMEFSEKLPRTVKPYANPSKPWTHILDYDVYLEKFIPFASPKFSWRDLPDGQSSLVVDLHLKNAMADQNISLSTLNPDQMTQKLGPLTLKLMPDVTVECLKKAIVRNAAYLYVQEGECLYISSEDEQPHAHTTGLAHTQLISVRDIQEAPHVVFLAGQKIGFGKGQDWQFQTTGPGLSAELPWMGFELGVEQWIENKYRHTEWFGNPPRGNESQRHSAALVTLKHRYKPKDAQTFWVDDTQVKSVATLSGFNFEFMVGNRLITLPFDLELARFKMDTNPGTTDPASYESFVTIKDDESAETTAHIYMNHPLKKAKYTFYQASYFVLDDGQTFGSVLSVNHDPGRWIKYAGSLLLVAGIVIHFSLRSFYKRKKFYEAEFSQGGLHPARAGVSWSHG